MMNSKQSTSSFSPYNQPLCSWSVFINILGSQICDQHIFNQHAFDHYVFDHHVFDHYIFSISMFLTTSMFSGSPCFWHIVTLRLRKIDILNNVVWWRRLCLRCGWFRRCSSDEILLLLFLLFLSVFAIVFFRRARFNDAFLNDCFRGATIHFVFVEVKFTEDLEEWTTMLTQKITQVKVNIISGTGWK